VQGSNYVTVDSQKSAGRDSEYVRSTGQVDRDPI